MAAKNLGSPNTRNFWDIAKFSGHFNEMDCFSFMTVRVTPILEKENATSGIYDSYSTENVHNEMKEILREGHCRPTFLEV